MRANEFLMTILISLLLVTNHLFANASSDLPEDITSIILASSVPDFAQDVDAALSKESYIYLFKGHEYIRIDMNTRRVSNSYPRSIAVEWRLPEGFHYDLDAAVIKGDYAYFFKGNKYVRFNLATNKPSKGYPQPLSNWRLPGDFGNGVDAVIARHYGLGDAAYPYRATHGKKGKLYFFKGDKYVRFDIAKDKADKGPANSWNLQGGIGIKMDAATDFGKTAYFFKNGKYTHFDLDNGQASAEEPLKTQAHLYIYSSGPSTSQDLISESIQVGENSNFTLQKFEPFIINNLQMPVIPKKQTPYGTLTVNSEIFNNNGSKYILIDLEGTSVTPKKTGGLMQNTKTHRGYYLERCDVYIHPLTPGISLKDNFPQTLAEKGTSSESFGKSLSFSLSKDPGIKGSLEWTEEHGMTINGFKVVNYSSNGFVDHAFKLSGVKNDNGMYDYDDWTDLHYSKPFTGGFLYELPNRAQSNFPIPTKAIFFISKNTNITSASFMVTVRMFLRHVGWYDGEYKTNGHWSTRRVYFNMDLAEVNAPIQASGSGQ